MLIVNVVALSLELAGYAVTKAADGVEALALIKSNPGICDVMILDHVMPELDGIGVVKQLRAMKHRGKVIVLSGHLDEQVQEEYKALGADKIMSKPYEMRELLDSVAALVS